MIDRSWCVYHRATDPVVSVIVFWLILILEGEGIGGESKRAEFSEGDDGPAIDVPC